MARPSRDSSWGRFSRSLLRGLRVFVVVGALGLAVGLGEFAASGGAYRWWTWIKVGALYLTSFFGVSARVGLGDRTLFDLHLPLMAGTALAGWLLVREGKRTLGEDRVLPAAGLALGFAAPISVLGFLARLRFPDLGGSGVDATVGALRWEAVLFPAGFAIAAVLIGSWWGSTPADGGLHRLVAGGWRMCGFTLALAFAGLLLLGSIRSDRTTQYASWLGSQGRGGALLFGHQVLAIPNQAFFALAPAMGGTTWVMGSGGSSPTSVSLASIGPVLFPLPGVGVPIPERRLGGIYRLFLLVPGIGTIVGGRAAAKGVVSIGRRAMIGAGSGVVFGSLVTVGSAFASMRSPITRVDGPLEIHVALASTAMLAMAWGVAGGTLGALFGQPWVGAEPGVEPPLNPTSA